MAEPILHDMTMVVLPLCTLSPKVNVPSRLNYFGWKQKLRLRIWMSDFETGTIPDDVLRGMEHEIMSFDSSNKLDARIVKRDNLDVTIGINGEYISPRFVEKDIAQWMGSILPSYAVRVYLCGQYWIIVGSEPCPTDYGSFPTLEFLRVYHPEYLFKLRRKMRSARFHRRQFELMQKFRKFFHRWKCQT